MDAVVADMQLDVMPTEGRDPSEEKVRVLGLMDDDEEREEPGDACDLCNGHGACLLRKWLEEVLQ